METVFLAALFATPWFPTVFFLWLGRRATAISASPVRFGCWMAGVGAMAALNVYASYEVWHPPAGSHPDGLEIVALPFLSVVELGVGLLLLGAIAGYAHVMRAARES